jgi:hypothetical protein
MSGVQTSTVIVHFMRHAETRTPLFLFLLSFPYPLEHSHSQFVVKILYYLKLELRLLSSYLCWSRRKDAEFNDLNKGWGVCYTGHVRTYYRYLCKQLFLGAHLPSLINYPSFQSTIRVVPMPRSLTLNHS